MKTRALFLLSLALLLSSVAPLPARASKTLAPVPAAAGSGRPVDYTKVKGLSKPRYETIRESFDVPMKDGVNIYVEVVRPKAPGRFGTILELSPYHGTLADRSGTRILPGPKDEKGNGIGLAGYFAPRGYAVVFADLRGTGRSEGCLDHMGPLDQSDGKEIVEWAAKQEWSNGRVGMTGHSYVGSTPQMTAAQKPPHLVTIVPSAGLGAMYHHEFQMGVPYFLQWAGPLFAYEQLSVERHLPGEDNEGEDMAYFGCGAKNSAAVTGEAYFSGAETQWHVERDFAAGATKADIPVFNVHGVDDNAARTPGMDWFNDRVRRGDKAWIGQWDHGSGVAPNSRTCAQAARTPCLNDQWTLALHAWFDKHLLQRRVNTGPAAEIFLNTGEIFTADQWPPRVDKEITFYPQADGTMTEGAQGEDAGSVSYVADQRGFENEFDTGSVVFETKPFKRDTLVVGIPKMRLTASVLGMTRVHLISSMYDVNGDRADLMGKAGFAINPELRAGIDAWAPVVPGEKMTMNLEGMAQAHVIQKGHSLRLIVASSHPDKVPTFAGGAHVTVYTGGKDGSTLTLPIIYNPKTYPDFLLKP